MNELLKFQEKEIRTNYDDGVVWFNVSDVCRALGIANNRNVTARIDLKDVHFIDTLTDGGKQKMSYVSEAGLYTIILRSNSPKAEPFTYWITHTVIPSLRKNGGYILGQENMTTEQIEQATDQLKLRLEYEKKKNDVLTVKADAYTTMIKQDDNIYSIEEFSKMLNKTNFKIGRTKLYSYLRSQKYLMKNNLPYQRYINGGYFVVKKVKKSKLMTFVTDKGINMVWKKLHKTNLKDRQMEIELIY